MTGRSTYQLFTPSGCLSLKGMEQFRQGVLTETERTLVQKHLNDCLLCMDAIDGISLIDSKSDLHGTIQDINRLLLDKFEGSASGPGTIKIFPKRSLSYIAAAASIVILIGLMFFINNPLKNRINQHTAQELKIEKKAIPQKPEVGIEITQQVATKDSVDQVNLSGKAAEVVEEELQVVSENKTSVRVTKSSQKEIQKPDGSSLEAFMEKEETQTLEEEIPGNYPDIASSQPLVYYLKEVTVSNSGLNAMTPSRRVSTKTEKLQGKETVGPIILSEEKSKANDNPSVTSHFFNPVEVMPEFPGGFDGLNTYLSIHLLYPDHAKKHGISGRVIISFIVDKNGHPTKVKVSVGIGGGCDEEAVRVIQSMPPWSPATQNGEVVPVMFTLPVNFKIL